MKEELTFEVKDDRFKQEHRPTCAIYSFLNGLFYKESNKKISTECINNVADELWKHALKSKSSITTKLDSRNTCSLVGEFFNTESLISFLKSILNESNFKEFHSLLNSTGTNSDNIKIRCIDSVAEFDRELTKNFENVFYIVPINADNTCKNNMHWICIKKGEILNSATNKYLRKAAKKTIKLSKNYSKNEVETMFKRIHNRNKDMYKRTGRYPKFDFHSWAKKRCKLKKEYPSEYQKRIKEISELSTCNYYFEYSDFNVIRVEVDRN